MRYANRTRTIYPSREDGWRGFGAIAPYFCEHCKGVWDKPIYKETISMSWSGPADGYWVCPVCHRKETIDENNEWHGFKGVRHGRK